MDQCHYQWCNHQYEANQQQAANGFGAIYTHAAQLIPEPVGELKVAVKIVPGKPGLYVDHAGIPAINVSDFVRTIRISRNCRHLATMSSRQISQIVIVAINRRAMATEQAAPSAQVSGQHPDIAPDCQIFKNLFRMAQYMLY
jgi:hypothetical protein